MMGEKEPKQHSEIAHSVGVAVTQCFIVFLFFLVAMYVPCKAEVILWPTTVICVALVFYWSVNWYKILLKEYRDSKITALTLYMVFTYLLLASQFGGLFVASERLGGSIVYSNNTTKVAKAPFEHLYFSFVTGSTLGYGDLCPLRLSRLLACLEVLMFWILVVAGTLKLGIE